MTSPLRDDSLGELMGQIRATVDRSGVCIKKMSAVFTQSSRRRIYIFARSPSHLSPVHLGSTCLITVASWRNRITRSASRSTAQLYTSKCTAGRQ
jgi:hypothetical protein